MLINALLPLHRLEPLANNSKKHNTTSTASSISKYGFRDPIQVDLVLLDAKYQALDWDDIISDDSIMLPLVVGHDRRNALLKAFANNANQPPKNCELVKLANGRLEWLVPGTVARSESVAQALAYSIDHNLTTIAALEDENTRLLLFDAAKLAEQASEIAFDSGHDFLLAGLDLTMADLSERLSGFDDGLGSDDSDDDFDSDDDDLVPEDNKPVEIDEDGLHECPKCGYKF